MSETHTLAGTPADSTKNLPEASLENVYIIEYRADGAIHHRNFVHSEGHSSAIERAKLYCTKMRYRFIFCTPFLTDFERDERRMANFG